MNIEGPRMNALGRRGGCSVFPTENLTHKPACSYLKFCNKFCQKQNQKKELMEAQTLNNGAERITVAVIEPKELAEGRNQESQVNKLAEGGNHQLAQINSEFNII